jgi:hypothetical protein
MNDHPEPIRTYGEPGGIYLSYTLDMDRDFYVVTNEGGDELFKSGNELDAMVFCEEMVRNFL